MQISMLDAKDKYQRISISYHKTKIFLCDIDQKQRSHAKDVFYWSSIGKIEVMSNEKIIF